MSVIVSIALATICFTSSNAEECYPVLLGRENKTPIGEFQMHQRYTKDRGYGGDVIQFYEDSTTVYAIHRVWLLKPEQHRLERLKSGSVSDRFVSSGCINVDSEVYQKLVNCCIDEKLIIR